MKRIMKKINRPTLIAAATACSLLLPLANAEARDYGADRFTTYGKVIRAEPIYRDVVVRVPVEQCYVKEERYVVQEGYSNRPHNGYRNSHNKRHSGSSGKALAGTVIGGVIGNQLGRNSSSGARVGATVAGAIIGSVIANEVRGGGYNSRNTQQRHRRFNNHSSNHYQSRKRVYGVRPVEHCETIIKTSREQRIDGYNVTYIHRGRRLKTRTRNDPGQRIALRAKISPVRGQ